MPHKPRFEPKWPEDENGPNGLYYPDVIEDRTPHPEAVPQEVRDIVVSTYTSATTVFENEHAKFTLFPKLPVELRRTIWRHSLPGSRLVEVFLLL